MSQCNVQVNLELGHSAQLREVETSEDFTHDWTVFVRGQQTDDIQHFVEKVVFHLHESYPKPKRVFKEPPYKVVESGSIAFLMHIEVFLKNKDKPKKVCLRYNLNLKPEGDHLRCETLTFNSPNKDFKRKLIKAGGVKVFPEGTEASSRSSQDSPMRPTKKIKTCHVSENPAKKEVAAAADNLTREEPSERP